MFFITHKDCFLKPNKFLFFLNVLKLDDSFEFIWKKVYAIVFLFLLTSL